jgi:hypothetical protein
MRERLLSAALTAAVVAGAAGAGSATTGVGLGRSTLGAGDSFAVRGSQVLCRVASEFRAVPRELVCGLRDPRTGGTLGRSRVAVISDASVVIRRAVSELVVSGALFRTRQPITLAGLPFAGADDRGTRLVLESGHGVAVAGTHIWCTDVEATLTCAKVRPPHVAVPAGTFAIAISRTSIGVAQARVGGGLVPLATWPLIGGR